MGSGALYSQLWASTLESGQDVNSCAPYWVYTQQTNEGIALNVFWVGEWSRYDFWLKEKSAWKFQRIDGGLRIVATVSSGYRGSRLNLQNN